MLIKPHISSLSLFGFGQVELDHARLAMIAVLMSGVVGAGAGAGAGVYMNAHDGFSAVRFSFPLRRTSTLVVGCLRDLAFAWVGVRVGLG